MAGVQALRKIQLGQETTPGTPVAATAIWRGIGTIEDTREMVFPEEHVGFVAPLDRSYQPKIEGALTFEETPATFQQLPYVLAAGVSSVVSGAADGAGSGKIYAYPLPTTTKGSFKSFTLEGGDDQQAEEFNLCFVTDFQLSGEAFAAWMMTANWMGREVTPSTFTGALTINAVEEILFSKTKLYIDAIGGTIGTTQITGTLLSAALNCVTGLRPVPVGDGNLFYSSADRKIKPELTLELTLEHNASAVAQVAKFRAETPVLVRLEVQGSALSMAGTTYSFHTLRIDMAGLWESFDKIDEQDGDDIRAGTFRAGYDLTAAQFATLTVVNEVTALP
ncbi:MAG: phage tail tube protein [Acidimicrobiales bacterium]